MPLKELKILFCHGKQYVPDLKNVELTSGFRGRPVISHNILKDEAEYVAMLCPVNAINVLPCSIDLGKCVFCKECQFALPDKIHFTNDFKMAVTVSPG